MVNFVIFVVDGVEVLKSIGSDIDNGAHYTELIAKSFNCPYLSFKGSVILYPVVITNCLHSTMLRGSYIIFKQLSITCNVS